MYQLPQLVACFMCLPNSLSSLSLAIYIFQLSYNFTPHLSANIKKKRKRKVLEISPLIISPEVRSSSSLPYFIHFYNSSTYPHTYINFCPPDIALPTTPGCVSSVSIFLSLLFLSFRHPAHSPTSTKVKSDRH